MSQNYQLALGRAFRHQHRPHPLHGAMGVLQSAGLLVLSDGGYSVSFQIAVPRECSSLFLIPTSWSLEIFKAYLVSLLCAIYILRKFHSFALCGKSLEIQL